MLPVPHLLPLIASSSYTAAVSQLVLSESVLIGMSPSPDPEEIRCSAAHLAKVGALLAMLPKSEMDKSIRHLDTNGDFQFDYQLRMIELTERPKYLH
ncbi:hypothetical protein ACFS07_35575 [Undibacterium arcticum]